MALRVRSGQSLIEYTLLIIVVAAALMAMTTYITRSMNARLKNGAEELDYHSKD